MKHLLFTASLIFLQVCPLLAAFNVTAEGELRTGLLSTYNIGVRPDAVVDVSVLFNLITINDLNIRSQTLSLAGWFVMSWTDNRITWNSLLPQYDGINFMFFTQTEVWRPALVVENSVTDLSVIEDDNVPIRAFSNGRMVWNPPGIYQTNCDIDITKYPFDTQSCFVSLKSVGYNIREINLTVLGGGIKTSDYKENGEWSLLNATWDREESTDTTDAETYATLQFRFNLKRRTIFYGLNIILPVFVLALLSTVVFLLPLESGEKMGYTLTVMLAIAVFLTMIADQIPTTSKTISILTIYISTIVIQSGLSVILSLIALDLFYQDDRQPIPKWLRRLAVNVLMPFACWRGCCSFKSNRVSVNSSASSFNVDGKYRNKASYAMAREPGLPDVGVMSSAKYSDTEDGSLSWIELAKVFDACCLRIYIALTTIVTLLCFIMLTVG